MHFSAFKRYQKSNKELIPGQVYPHSEDQRGEYESGLVCIGDELWRIRTAKITPTRPGAFVAVWKRDEEGETRPFDVDDITVGLMVFVQDGEHFGVFRFTVAQPVLLGVTRSEAKPGKRGFRVYPSWSIGLNAQATRTQALQAPAFELLD